MDARIPFIPSNEQMRKFMQTLQTDDKRCSCKPGSYPGFWITEGCPLHGIAETARAAIAKTAAKTNKV